MSHARFSDTEKIQLVIVAVVLAAMVFPHMRKSDMGAAVPEVRQPSFYVSADTVEQGSVFFVGVTGATAPGGRFSGEELSFFDVASGAVAALVAADVKASPGERTVTVWNGDSAVSKTVIVLERAFPVTKIVVTEELESAGYTPQTITKNLAEEEKPTIAELTAPVTPKAYFSDPFVYPLSEIVVEGAFGNIRQEGNSAFQHLGVDLKADTGTPVHAVAAGKVVFADALPTYGNTVVIDHGLGIYSLYLHLDRFIVSGGDIIAGGTDIASSGNTGYSIEPHLHFSVKVDGASVDPLQFIETTRDIFTNSDDRE